jgi:aspartyl-tRNA synthetase
LPQVDACGASDGDLLLFAAGTFDIVSKTLDRVRQYVAEQLGEIPSGKHNVLWVTDFPMFGWNEAEQRLEASCLGLSDCRTLTNTDASRPARGCSAGDAPPIHRAQRR